ncbi:MAG: type 1 periplasmic binding fold superfamily protein [Winogradskyella sp.]|nr:type 1 periplasmic binding fold superfamily protein [Winogradskyella sp.]MBT8375397.1 type 1 periplasmic binding fold superfamily protein [Bacteroidia bacterium]NNC46644.1 type 1 periplasmic binding fold superfamily protein [Winogradskyella sp.]NNF85677.1 type 1 periplasmic binding fold superfamily protein [Winogradskyella sp.]NNK40685.1 type 1 periplasmic binding fold superfamily protein [Winogradskyella sp.]
MKSITYVFILALISVLTLSCSSDDDPTIVNEEEVITTLRLTLTPEQGGTDIVFQTQDLDGDGPNAPETTVSSPLSASTAYTGTIQLLNELESPAENITLEVQAEDEEHQLFYTLSGNGNVSITYTDQDSNGNPVGLNIVLNSGDASTNSLTVTLRHEPNKDAVGVSDGDITNAGGETDIQTTFNFTVEN